MYKSLKLVSLLFCLHNKKAHLVFVTLHSIWHGCRLEMRRCCHIQWGLSTPIRSDHGWSISIKLHKSTLNCSFPVLWKTAGAYFTNLAPPKKKKINHEKWLIKYFKVTMKQHYTAINTAHIQHIQQLKILQNTWPLKPFKSDLYYNGEMQKSIFR